jgi:intracellular sulfur oxidation DsrE/DsrF family protein
VITKLNGGKEVVRELCHHMVQDAGARELIVTVRGDGVMYLRAKGMSRQVMWKLEALYEKGIKEGRSI